MSAEIATLDEVLEGVILGGGPAYKTSEELRDKIDWEGGVTEFIFGYGLNLDDLPEETPLRVVHAFRYLIAGADDVEIIQNWLEGDE